MKPALSKQSPEPGDSSIPNELRACPQWVGWLSVVGEDCPLVLPNGQMTKVLKRQAKPHKLPINARTGGLASTTRASTWVTFEEALGGVNKWSLSGLGFVFTDSDPYAGVDMDNCRSPETGEIAGWAWEVIRALDSYTEVSPSRTGVHIIIRGELPKGQGNQAALNGGKVEMFSRARYFTFTGIPVDGVPSDIRDRQTALLALHAKLFIGSGKAPVVATAVPFQPYLVVTDDELIAKAKSAKNGQNFERLWTGSWKGDYPSQSEADSALCCYLAFWTGNDLARMDALFRRSGLMREKWERADYRERTLARAAEKTTETYNPRQPITGWGKSPIGLAAGDLSVEPSDWGPPTPFHQFELPPFPVSSLSGWLREFVEAEATATQTPVALGAMLGLAVVAAACAKKIVIEIKPGYREPVNIYAVVSLPSGSRKSTVFAELIAPLEDYEESEGKRTAGAIARALTARRIKESKLRRLQDRAAEPDDKKRSKFIEEAELLAEELARTSPPAAMKVLADDCTPEKLAGLLSQNDGRIAVVSPEGDVFDLMGGRYSSNKKGNFGVYLKGHSGDSIRVDRVGRPPEFVKAPAITVGLAVQPEVIRGLAAQPGFRGRGLLARFLFAMPKSLLGRRVINAPPVHAGVKSDYHANVLALLNLPLEKDGRGEANPYVLQLEPDASEALRNFEIWIEPQLSEFGPLGSISDWGGKLVGAVARIAALLHMVGSIGCGSQWQAPITRVTMERAIDLGTHFIPNAKAAFAEMGADPVVEKSKKLLRWIAHADLDSFTQRDAHQALRGVFTTPAELEAPLLILIGRDFIRMRTQERKGPGRKGSPVFDVNPLWDRRHESGAAADSSNSEYCEHSEMPNGKKSPGRSNGTK